MVEQRKQPGSQRREVGDRKPDPHAPAGVPAHHRVLAHLLDHSRSHDGIDVEERVPLVPLTDLPGLAGDSRRRVQALGKRGAARLAQHRRTLQAVHPKGSLRVGAVVPTHQIPVAPPEPEPTRGDLPDGAAVLEGHARPGAQRLPHGVQVGRSDQGGKGVGVVDAGGSQLQQRTPPAKVAEVDTGYGQVQRALLLPVEIEIGEVVAIRIDPVPELLGPLDRLRDEGDALFPQQSLVPLESLPARALGPGITGDLLSDLLEGHRPPGIEQHEEEVGEALEPVIGHCPQRTAPAYGSR